MAFRIFQEALTNAVRHGQTDGRHGSRLHADTTLQLCVRDDGVGIPPATSGSSRSRSACSACTNARAASAASFACRAGRPRHDDSRHAAASEFMIAARPFPSSPHIMLVDDHPIVRRGVRDILSDAFPSAIIEEVSFGADAILLLLQHSRWDVVILDLSLPDGSGMDVLERIRAAESRPAGADSQHALGRSVRRAARSTPAPPGI